MATTTPTLWKALSQANIADLVESQSDGQIAAMRSGGYLVAWTDNSRVHNTDGTAIVGRRYNLLGNAAVDEVKISEMTDGDQSAPAATTLANGSLAVAFVDTFVSDTDIYVGRRSAALGMLPTVTINSGPERTVDPSITAFADGSYAVAYTAGPIGGDTDITARVVSATGAIGAEFDIFVEGNPTNAELATLSNGNFVAVFQHDFRDDATTHNISYAVHNATGGFLFSGGIAVGPMVDETDPDVAALTGGGFVVVWTEPFGDDSGTGIRATFRANDGGTLRTNFQVNTTTAGAQNEASVAALADGGFLITWEDDAADVVRAQRYDRHGDRVGSEFVVKIGVGTGNPDVAGLRDGRIGFALGDVSTGDADVVTSIWDPRTGPLNGTPDNDPITSRLEGAVLNGFAGGDTLFGVHGPDVFNGGRDSDQLLGQGGDDRFIHAPGDDFDQIIDFVAGSASADDRLDLRAHSNIASLGAIRARAVVVGTDTDIFFGGNDAITLSGIAPGELVAADFIFRIPDDFGGDALADILWRHTDGTANVYAMNGATVLSGSNLSVQPGSAWQVADKADFTGDGNTDILWRHTVDATINVYRMNGATVLSGSNISMQPGADWHIAGTGDFNRDGKDDILLRHTDGTLNIYLMDGATVLGGSNISMQPGSGWQVSGVGDFNGDGRSDILLRDAGGTLNVFLMNGVTVLGGSNISVQPGGSWQVQDVNDLSGDGKADILLRHADGTANAFLMDGATVLGGSNLSAQPGLAWEVKDTADYNGDGRTDILWRHSDGTANVYLMDGSTVLGASNISVQPGSDWLVA